MSMMAGGAGDELSEAPGRLSQLKQVEDEEEEMTEEEKLEQERRFQMNRMQQQMQRPLVFGLTEDVKYNQHKIPVRHFIENRNNK